MQGGEGTLAKVGKSRWDWWLAQVGLSLPACAKSLDPWPCMDKSSRQIGSPQGLPSVLLTAFLWPREPGRASALLSSEPSLTFICIPQLHTGLSIFSKGETLILPQSFGTCLSPGCLPYFPLVSPQPSVPCHLWGGRGRTVPATSLLSSTVLIHPCTPQPLPGKTTLVASRGLVPELKAPSTVGTRGQM